MWDMIVICAFIFLGFERASNMPWQKEAVLLRLDKWQLIRLHCFKSQGCTSSHKRTHRQWIPLYPKERCISLLHSSLIWHYCLEYLKISFHRSLILDSLYIYTIGLVFGTYHLFIVSLQVDLKPKPIPSCCFYYDMKYSVDYCTFQTMEISKLFLFLTKLMHKGCSCFLEECK